MNEITKALFEVMKQMDDLGCGELELALEFKKGKKRTIKVQVEEEGL